MPKKKNNFRSFITPEMKRKRLMLFFRFNRPRDGDFFFIAESRKAKNAWEKAENLKYSDELSEDEVLQSLDPKMGFKHLQMAKQLFLTCKDPVVPF